MPRDSKFLPIDYTSREFDSIREDRYSYATRYYSDSFKDFTSTSFASLMIDTVAYVGDILSFYIDYQVSEMFLDTTTEYENILRIGKQYGYKHRSSPVSQGILEFYILVPAGPDGGLSPDSLYLPKLRRGSSFSSTSGVSFTLTEDVDFANSNTENVVARINDASIGGVNVIAVKAVGRVISGQSATAEVPIGEFRRFQRIEIPDSNISEITSVTDEEGNEYYEVDYLSQNVIYKAIPNTGEGQSLVPNILVPQIVPRRFITEENYNSITMIFGYGSEAELKTNIIDDPRNVAIDFYGKNYITDKSFDPSRIIETDKFGIAPANTTLTVKYRTNNVDMVNAESNSIINVNAYNMTFPAEEFLTNTSELDASLLQFVRNSLECNNTNAIVGDITQPNTEEMKLRIMDTFSAQNRAVTVSDYKAIIYNMPNAFGAVKKCNIVQNYDSNKRSVNAYILSEDNDGHLIKSNITLKNNIKTWLSDYKMINDSVNIINGKIINLGIDFTLVSESNHNKYNIMVNAKNELQRELFTKTMEFGQPFYITKVYDILRKVSGVLDVSKVKIRQVVGDGYSNTVFNIDQYTSPDGRYITCPLNAVFELKNMETNIIGTVR